jgi:hypothetical protein
VDVAYILQHLHLVPAAVLRLSLLPRLALSVMTRPGRKVGAYHSKRKAFASASSMNHKKDLSSEDNSYDKLSEIS